MMEEISKNTLCKKKKDIFHISKLYQKNNNVQYIIIIDIDIHYYCFLN